MSERKKTRFKSVKRAKTECSIRTSSQCSETVCSNTANEDILGKDARNLTFEVINKINILSNHFRGLIQNAKILARSNEGHLYNVGTFLQTGESVSAIIQKGMPSSIMAHTLKKALRIIGSYETEKFKNLSDALSKRLSKFESSLEQTLSRIKNYIKVFASDEKERLEVMRSSRSRYKKVKRQKDDTTKEMNEYNGACFDLKSLREDNFRKVLRDFNFINSMFMDIYILYIKVFLELNYNYRFEILREHVLEMEDLVSSCDTLPDDLEYLLKNVPKFSTYRKSVFEIYERPIEEEINANKEKVNDQSVTFFSNMKPFSGNPRETRHQRLATQAKELNLAEGDLIICYTDVYDGWQYGLNMTSLRRGWFPVAYTENTDCDQIRETANNLLREYHCPFVESKRN